MAGRTLNRMELRAQSERAEQLAKLTQAPEVSDADAETAPATAGRAKTPPRARKPRAKKAPPRMRACWGIFDNAMKRIATFEYNQRDLAEARLVELQAQKKGSHYVQMVKEPMPEDASAVVG